MKIFQEHGYYTADEQNRFHSFDDEPAVVVEDYLDKDISGEEINVSGYQAWYKNGLIHRENGPAVIRNSGEEFYYLDGNVQ